MALFQNGDEELLAAADELNDLLHEVVDRFVEAYPNGRIAVRIAYGTLIFAPSKSAAPWKADERDDFALTWMSPQGHLVPIFHAPLAARVEATHAVFAMDHNLRIQRDEFHLTRATTEAAARLRDWLHGHPAELLKKNFQARHG